MAWHGNGTIWFKTANGKKNRIQNAERKEKKQLCWRQKRKKGLSEWVSEWGEQVEVEEVEVAIFIVGGQRLRWRLKKKKQALIDWLEQMRKTSSPFQAPRLTEFYSKGCITDEIWKRYIR
jgi:hypothetical protein